MTGVRADLLLPITAFYTGLSAVFYTAIFIAVLIYRYIHDCQYGDADNNKTLVQLEAARSAFTQIVPFALFMLAVAEVDAIQGSVGIWILGALLLFFLLLLMAHALVPRLPHAVRVAGYTGVFCWFITVGITMIVRDWRRLTKPLTWGHVTAARAWKQK